MNQDALAHIRQLIAQKQAEAGLTPATSARPAAGPTGEDEPTLSAEELTDECIKEPMTDIGNARRLLTRHGGRILHVARVGWHGYDGRRWKEDEDGSVVRPLAQQAAEAILEEAYALEANEDERAILDEGAAAERAIKELGAHRAARKKKAGKGATDWTAEESEQFAKLEPTAKRAMALAGKIEDRQTSRFRHAKSSAGTSKLNAMLTEAAPHCARMVNDLNCERLALNLTNGTMRFIEVFDDFPGGRGLAWSTRIDPHRPGDYISKLAPHPFSGQKDRWEARAPVFDGFLKTILPDVDIRRFLQRFFGYCLTGRTDEQCLLFLYGIGRNGKSTLMDLIVDILGDYAVTLSIDSFAGDTRRGGAEATPDLARLPGARLVAASEPEMGVKLKDALIKSLTGGEKIPVRRLHQDFIEVEPHFKIVLSGNHKPRIDDTSDGIWRRVHLVPFDVQIPKEEIDRELPAKLRAEAEGILQWMIEGALAWLEYGLRPPESVLAATQEYREESDPIGAFIRGGCVVTGREEDIARPDDLFIGYSNFASREGLLEFKQNTFSRRFPEYTRRSWPALDGQMKQFAKGKSGSTVYRGITVKSEFLTPKGEG
ncbi:phage/plasmid primase, P4 family [Notoacmeibacter sp. MSK16QG-6]|uniref:DNA primase family protein n=1 Tax=Notoacmeibacter sp. MSK16QG-6 TaxID=2957982 RepID=UPI00209E1367|nr:phage/plasmid primase, P4 family [Notoacmeibacter sp. MSK16QG-6]MCP1200071.1 phage/plasmid primase, P4 family [Notoacmeibacter sp. MSK16QG-6]